MAAVAKTLRARLKSLNAEALDACPPEQVDNVAWLLAQTLLEDFRFEIPV